MYYIVDERDIQSTTYYDRYGSVIHDEILLINEPTEELIRCENCDHWDADKEYCKLHLENFEAWEYCSKAKEIECTSRQ